MINYWEYLGIPMNCPTAMIKQAFQKKYIAIKNGINENKSTPKDLLTALTAFNTLLNPRTRYIHNCEINGENPDGDLVLYIDHEYKEEDLDEEDNFAFCTWLETELLELINKGLPHSYFSELLAYCKKHTAKKQGLRIVLKP